MRPHRSSALLGLLFAAGRSLALDLNLNDTNSIKAASKTIVGNIINIYGTPNAPGVFPQPQYYWFESGLAWDSLINYWALTGDDSYVNLTRDALLWQISPSDNFMPANQSKQLGNDDQSTWGLAAMTAAEKQFPAPDGNISWVQLAQNVFDSQAARWDTQNCGGGLRWQIYAFNNGYNYKNSQSNGNLAQLAARLARFTGNHTYSDWASEAVAWSQKTGLLTQDGSVFDGSDLTTNCSNIDKVQWTSTSGTFIAAAAYMTNVTGGNSTWTNLVESLVSHANAIFAAGATPSEDGVLYESACAPFDNCDSDQLSYRAILARALTYANTFSSGSNSTVRTAIDNIIQKSANGAAAQCSGGSNNTLCGSSWNSSKWDGTSGLGQDLSALEIILANLPATPVANANSTGTAATNGTVTGNGSSTNSSSGAQESHTPNGASSVVPSVLLSALALGFTALI